MSNNTEVDHLLGLLVEGAEIVNFYGKEVTRLQGALSLLLWDHSGAEGHEQILKDISDALGASLQREKAFDEG